VRGNDRIKAWIKCLVIVVWMPVAVKAQSCPPADQRSDGAESSTLHGTLVHFDELREWLGVKLDQSACGEKVVQLVFTGQRAREVDAYRGCEVTVTGKLYEPATGYYSARLAMQNADVKAAPSCHPQAVQPDPSKVAVPADLTSYEASITVDYRGKGRVAAKAWRIEGAAALEPVQAYVSYELNGAADVLHFNCAGGFEVTNVHQTPKGAEPVSEGYFETTGLNDLSGVNKLEFRCEKKSIK